MKDILLFGIQGSGKGTQAKLLQQKFSKEYAYFSSGELFRGLTQSDNLIGEFLKEAMKSGQLIDDKVTNALFELYFYMILDKGMAMLLDGYPRSLSQFELMLDECQRYRRDMIGIYLHIPDEEAIKRIKERGRPDDTDELIARRIAQYHEITEPMIKRFRQVYPVYEIDSTPETHIVQKQIQQFITHK